MVTSGLSGVLLDGSALLVEGVVGKVADGVAGSKAWLLSSGSEDGAGKHCGGLLVFREWRWFLVMLFFLGSDHDKT